MSQVESGELVARNGSESKSKAAGGEATKEGREILDELAKHVAELRKRAKEE